MSGTASVPNTFETAVTATGLQLDTNFNTVVAYINNPTNRNNYAADGAATNTVVLTFSPPLVGGYTAGVELTWKWGVTNTGATVLNANGLGNINVVNPDGSALQANQGAVGSIGKAIYDGTRAVYITPPTRQVAKAWAQWNGTNTGTITAAASQNVGTIVKTGTGTYSISYSTGFTSSIYAAVASANILASVIAKAPTGCTINTLTTAAVADATDVNFVAFGDQ